MASSSSIVVPSPSPLPAEFSRTSSGLASGAVAARGGAALARRPRRQHPGDAVRDARDPERHAGPLVAPDVDVDVAGAVVGGDGHLVGQEGDRLLEEVLGGAGEVHEVRRVDGDRPDAEVGHARAEGAQLGRWVGTPLPRGRVVDEDLQRIRADRMRPLDGAHHPVAEGQVGAERPAVGERRVQRRGLGGGGMVECAARGGHRARHRTVHARPGRARARPRVRRRVSGPAGPAPGVSACRRPSCRGRACTRRRPSARSARSRRPGDGRGG